MARSAEQLLELPEIKPPKKMPEGSRIADSDPATMSLAVVLAEAHNLMTAEKRMKACRERIRELMLAMGKDGVRCGTLCAINRFQAGRKTFSPELAIEVGVTPDQIAASMKEGAGYWVTELPEIKDE